MDLAVQKRGKFGKAAKALRREGLIPAELYGHGLENIHLSVSAKDFHKVFKSAGESAIVNIVMEHERRPVLIHDVALHPVTEQVLNIDFYQVRLDERIKVKIPLNFTGEAPGVKDKGGVLVKSVHEVEVEALPGGIPPALQVPLEALTDIGSSVHMKDVKIPAGVKVFISPETVIATIKEKIEEEAAPAAEVTVESVKVETEEKKVERAAKKEAIREESPPSK